MRNIISLACLSIITLSGCNPPSTTAPAPLTPGQEIFLTHCASCHNGGGNPPGPNFSIIGSPRMTNEESFKELLRKPTSAMMPAFDPALISDAQAHDLYTWLQAEIHQAGK